MTATPDRVRLVQPLEWDRRRGSDGGGEDGSPYADDRCCYCYRSLAPDAALLRTARTNDGEWWIVSAAADLSADEWRDFQTQLDGSRAPTLLPIGAACLRTHPEFRIGLVQR